MTMIHRGNGGGGHPETLFGGCQPTIMRTLMDGTNRLSQAPTSLSQAPTRMYARNCPRDCGVRIYLPDITPLVVLSQTFSAVLRRFRKSAISLAASSQSPIAFPIPQCFQSTIERHPPLSDEDGTRPNPGCATFDAFQSSSARCRSGDRPGARCAAAVTAPARHNCAEANPRPKRHLL